MHRAGVVCMKRGYMSRGLGSTVEEWVQWSLAKMVTALGSHLFKRPASLSPNSTKALQSLFVEQSPLYKDPLELAHRWLSKTGFTI